MLKIRWLVHLLSVVFPTFMELFGWPFYQHQDMLGECQFCPGHTLSNGACLFKEQAQHNVNYLYIEA